MSQTDQTNRAPTSTIVGSWFFLLAGWVCMIVWIEDKGRGWIAGAVIGVTFWAAFWLDYLQRKVEGRL